MEDRKTLLDTASLVASRLERLSVDSYWAHRASGLRGSLIRSMERIEDCDLEEGKEQEHLRALILRGFEILGHAAREIRTPELTY